MSKKQTTREKLLDYTFEEVYIHGYNATSIDSILKRANVPKGSMYHHFKSKKELVLAMVKERLFVKMDAFFIYEVKEGASVTQSLRDTFLVVSKNRMLVTYGCPLYRLMVELSAVDSDFDSLLSTKAKAMREGIKSMLLQGIAQKEYQEHLDAEAFAGFILNATWGVLSLSPSLSSSENFINQTDYILELLSHYRY